MPHSVLGSVVTEVNKTTFPPLRNSCTSGGIKQEQSKHRGGHHVIIAKGQHSEEEALTSVWQGREGFMEEVALNRSWRMTRRAFQPVQGVKEEDFFFF